MDIMEDLYTTTFSNNESFFKKAAAEIESLRAKVAELKAENEQLRLQWAGCSQQLKDACDDLSKVEEACSKLTRQRDEAVQMLADWCDAVRDNGTGWDDWDEHYKDAAWRQCGIRELIDAARTAEGEIK